MVESASVGALLNWIEPRTTDPEVGGSSPSALTTLPPFDPSDPFALRERSPLRRWLDRVYLAHRLRELVLPFFGSFSVLTLPGLPPGCMTVVPAPLRVLLMPQSPVLWSPKPLLEEHGEKASAWCVYESVRGFDPEWEWLRLGAFRRTDWMTV